MSAWLNHTVTNGDLIVIFMTWLICYLISGAASAVRRRMRSRRKTG